MTSSVNKTLDKWSYIVIRIPNYYVNKLCAHTITCLRSRFKATDVASAISRTQMPKNFRNVLFSSDSLYWFSTYFIILYYIVSVSVSCYFARVDVSKKSLIVFYKIKVGSLYHQPSLSESPVKICPSVKEISQP